MTDPWTLHSELTCPSCHVTGKVVTNEDENDGSVDAPYICVDCGQTWLDDGAIGDKWLKECRIHFARLVEGRPYEPPKPVQRESGKGIDAGSYDAVLRQYYAAASVYELSRGTWALPIGAAPAVTMEPWAVPESIGAVVTAWDTAPTVSWLAPMPDPSEPEDE